VHVDGKPMRSCSVPIGALDGAKVLLALQFVAT
jgi:aerobic-type carbon monoxide dehydrogenase small subunit (CoxS/CutS family)